MARSVPGDSSDPGRPQDTSPRPSKTASNVDLRPAFRADETRRYRSRLETSLRVGTARQASVFKTTYTFRPVSVGPGGAEVELRWTSASILVRTGERERHFDTRTPDDPEASPALGRLLDAFVGATLRIRFGPDGSVRSIEGLDAILDAPGVQALGTLLEEEGLRQTLRGLVRPTPGRDRARVGERWTERERSSFDKSSLLVRELDYRLARADAERAVIECDGTARLEPAPARGSAAQRPVSHRLTGQDIRGRVVWHPGRRHVRLHELELYLALEGPGPAGPATEMVIRRTSRTQLVPPGRAGDGAGGATFPAASGASPAAAQDVPDTPEPAAR